jgi:pimeloyl-ACP methyl ester carboxylesterase
VPYTRNGPVRIYWEEEGSGDPLLLIMGLSFSLAMWEELRHFFAQHFRIVLFDNRCIGKSDSPLAPFSIGTMAEDAAVVMDAAGVPKAHIFGFSMGGMIAQELAARYPGRVDKLILGCTHCAGGKAVFARLDALLPLASPFLSREKKLRRIIPLLYHSHTPAGRIERDLLLIRRNPATVRGYLQQVAAIGRWRLQSKPGRISARTLVIHGEADRLVPPENARIVAGLIPGAKLALLPGAGHIFPTDQPERTRSELTAFLKPSTESGMKD